MNPDGGVLALLLGVQAAVLRYSLSHVGAGADHWYSGRQITTATPTRWKPFLHVYVAVEPMIVPLCFTDPLAGDERFGHETATTEGERSVSFDKIYLRRHTYQVKLSSLNFK